ncbi:MAG: DNA primase [Clostridia bacterium]|nr:DNA primase [Clostridia bacterium]
MIDRGTVEEVVARTDTVALISSYVTLKRTGANYTGLCPFHSEKTGSFTVFGGKGNFYCFGCGAGGDAINFVRRIENLEFEEAVEFLAKRAGITVRRTEDKGERGPRYDRRRLYEMNREAARFFHARLFDDTPASNEARAYLTEKRGLSPVTIKHFGLGYAPSARGVFYRYMREKGFTDDEMIAGFLIGRSQKDGSLYDSFYNRVMFPIIDVSGNVIAFGGRIMDASAASKYKNSADTPVFLKRRNLFALNYARQSCAEKMILCEGYMDVIALHAAGFTNAVATLGTAITAEQARLMSQYTKSVIISYDSDTAGQNAAVKAMRLLEQVGLDVRVLRMEGAKDPDEYIKKFGAQAFSKLLGESRSQFDYRFERVLEKYNVAEPQEKIKAIAELAAEIASLSMAAERDVYIRAIAKRLEIDPKSLKQDVDRATRKNYSSAVKKNKEQLMQSSIGYADRINPDYAKNPAIARSEEAVLGLLLLYPDHRSYAFSENVLTENDFFTELGRRVFTYMRDAEAGEGFSESMMSEAFSPEEMGRIARMRVGRMQLTDNGREVFSDAVSKLRRLVSEKTTQESGVSRESFNELLKRRREEN